MCYRADVARRAQPLFRRPFPHMRRWLSFLLPLVGLAIFVWIIRGTGIGRILDALRAIEPRRLWVFPLFTLYFLWIRGLRWQHLLRMIGIECPLMRCGVLWAVGFFGGSVTPGKVGDAVRAYYLSRDTGRHIGECFLTVFIDRLLDLVTVLLFGIVTLLIFSFFYIHMSSVWIMVAAAFGILGFLYLLMHRGLVKKFMRPLFRMIVPERYRGELSLGFDSFYNSLGIYARRWPGTLVAVFYTWLFWGGVVILAFAVAWVLRIDIPLRFIALMMPATTLVELIPITVSGLGTREATVIYFFSVQGIGSATAVGFSITYLLVGTYLNAAVGFVAWLFESRRARG
jgi:uncharacterized protein (TIRG00374 family)